MPSVEEMISDDEEEMFDLGDLEDVTSIDNDDTSEVSGEAQEVKKLADYGDEYVFQTKDVARFVGLNNAQDVRNVMAVWDDVIKVKRDNNKRTVWSKEDIRKLKNMLDVKAEYGFTTAQTRDHFLNGDNDAGAPAKAAVPAKTADPAAIEAYMSQLSSNIETALDVRMNSIADRFDEKADAIQANMVAEIERGRQANEASIQTVLELIKGIQEGQKSRDEEIQRLKEENEALKASLEESKKRKISFPWFRKKDN